MDTSQYIALIVASVLIVAVFLYILRKSIPLQDKKGNSDPVGFDTLIP